MGQIRINSNGNFNLKTSSLNNNEFISSANNLLKNPGSINSVFSGLIDTIANNSQNDTFKQKYGPALAYFGAIKNSSSIVPKENRNEFIKNAIDSNGDGVFSQEDLNKLDTNGNDLINRTEMQTYLRKTAANTGAPLGRLNRIDNTIKCFGLFDNKGDVNPNTISSP